MKVRIINSAFWYKYGEEHEVEKTSNGMWYRSLKIGKFICASDCTIIDEL